VDAFVGRLKQWAQHHPEPIFAMFRELDPIAMVKHIAVVTRFDDVQEVLARDDIFQVPYADKFARLADGRRFVLGMSNSAEYERDTATLRMVMRREDIAQRVMPFVSQCAEHIVAGGAGRLDVVKELGDIVPSALVGEYLGTPSPEPRQFA